MASAPLYSKGRKARKFEGNRRKETGMMGSFVCSGNVAQIISFSSQQSSEAGIWFLPFHMLEIGAQRE